jgi:two-component system, response regulator YesN
MKKIMIVEDSPDMQTIYKIMFKKAGLVDISIAAQVETAEMAIDKIPEINPDLLIVDISLPGMDGIALCRLVKKQFPNIKVLIVTGHEREVYLAPSVLAGADDFTTKSDAKEIMEKVKKLAA